MKRFVSIVLLVWLLKTNFVMSKLDENKLIDENNGPTTFKLAPMEDGLPTTHNPCNASSGFKEIPASNQTKYLEPNGTLIPTYGVYLIGFTIGLLLFIVVSLLIIIYKMKQKECKFIEDKIEIAKDDYSNKYTLHCQLSSEGSEVSLKRPYRNDDSRFQLQRQNSKMTIVDFPNTSENNYKKCTEPDARKYNISKVLNKPIEPMQRECMKKICEAVLSKKQRESTSLSNLDKILNEKAKTNEETLVMIDKSASSPFLDSAESFEALYYTPKNNTEEFSDRFPKLSSNISSKHLPFRLPNINDSKQFKVSVKDDFNKHSPILPDEDEVEHIDDVYDNPLIINIPVSQPKEDDDISDEVYDNPPSTNRPLWNTIPTNKQSDELYDHIPTRSTSHIENHDEYMEDTYDNNPKCKKQVYDKSLSSPMKEKITDISEETGDHQYVLPNMHNRGIICADDGTGYVRTFTNGKETCFDGNYENAKLFTRTKSTK